MNLYGDMCKSKALWKALLVLLRCCGVVGNNRDHYNVNIRTHRPQMQVSEFTVIILFNAILDLAPDAFRPLRSSKTPLVVCPINVGFGNKGFKSSYTLQYSNIVHGFLCALAHLDRA